MCIRFLSIVRGLVWNDFCRGCNTCCAYCLSPESPPQFQASIDAQEKLGQAADSITSSLSSMDDADNQVQLLILLYYILGRFQSRKPTNFIYEGGMKLFFKRKVRYKTEISLWALYISPEDPLCLSDLRFTGIRQIPRNSSNKTRRKRTRMTWSHLPWSQSPCTLFSRDSRSLSSSDDLHFLVWLCHPHQAEHL